MRFLSIVLAASAIQLKQDDNDVTHVTADVFVHSITGGAGGAGGDDHPDNGDETSKPTYDPATFGCVAPLCKMKKSKYVSHLANTEYKVTLDLQEKNLKHYCKTTSDAIIEDMSKNVEQANRHEPFT